MRNEGRKVVVEERRKGERDEDMREGMMVGGERSTAAQVRSSALYFCTTEHYTILYFTDCTALDYTENTHIHCTAHPLQCTTHPLHCTTHPLQCTTHPLQCTTHPLQCTTHPLQCTTHPLHCTIHPLQCTTHPLHCTSTALHFT
jgi:hypothetical protein